MWCMLACSCTFCDSRVEVVDSFLGVSSFLASSWVSAPHLGHENARITDIHNHILLFYGVLGSKSGCQMCVANTFTQSHLASSMIQLLKGLCLSLIRIKQAREESVDSVPFHPHHTPYVYISIYIHINQLFSLFFSQIFIL